MAYEEYTFTSDMQDKILACIVAHPDRFLKFDGVLNSAFFAGTQRVAAARAIFVHWNKYGRLPSWEILGDIVYESISRMSEQKEENSIIDYVKKLKSMDTSDVDYVCDSVIAWARKRACYLAIDKAINAFHDGKVPDTIMNDTISRFDEAMKVGQNVIDRGYVLHPDFPDVEQALDKLMAKDYGIKTGFPLFDDIWPFGWGPGWLISVLAPPKRFKTTFCINLAMNMVNGASAPVLYYPCEITQELAVLRSLCNLTDSSSESFYKNPHSFRENVLQQMDFFKAPLVVRGFPSKTATVAGEIRSHARMVCQQLNIKPRALIIDYAETVKASMSDKRASEHRASADVYIESRALGSELECPVIIPDRCNKETVGRKVPSMKSFQGSFEKAGAVDVALGLCADDEEMLRNSIRYFVFLNRHGKALQHFRGRVDPERMRMWVDEKIPYDPEEDDYDEGGAGFKRQRRRKKTVSMPDEIQDP